MNIALIMKTMGGPPSSTTDKRTSIEIHTDNYIKDCQGQDVEINYKAVVIFTGRSKQKPTTGAIPAGFSIREKIVGWTKSLISVDTEDARDVVQIAIREGWPTNLGGWDRTVSITLPTTPEINASMKTKVMDITHSVLFTMKYKAEIENDRRAQEVTIEVPFQLVEPRRNLEDDFLPTYSATDAQAS
ncbi:hypothetical protein BGX33_000461 [Mortierella sp. NVP41]|nr:hypothetical protein BGX33_000461 [Mortierella sp. NVP41]